MPIDKQLLRQLLATEKFKKCADSPDSAAELGSTLSDTESLVRSCQNVQAIPFILGTTFIIPPASLLLKARRNLTVISGEIKSLWTSVAAISRRSYPSHTQPLFFTTLQTQ